VFSFEGGTGGSRNAPAIYLIPPKKEMIISGGKLLLTDRDPKQGLTLPIDDGLSALSTIEVEQPDVVFVDIGLPELDGYGVARPVRKTEAAGETYLVALTGYGQPADRKTARDAGFDGHLTKPVRMDDLLGIREKVARDRDATAQR
jgi:CheY-like chemotaxis protein